MKGMIEDGVTSVLQDFKVKKIYKSLLQIPTCTLAKGDQNIYIESLATPLLLCFLTGFESLRLHR